MVDPNRKINHLTEEDVKYLNECENEFKDRFTENDEEFMALYNKPAADPPIVTPWMERHGRSGNSGSSNYRGHRSGNYNNQRPYHHRSNRGGSNYHNRNYHNSDNDSSRRGTKRPHNYNSGGNDRNERYHKRD